MGGGTGNLHVEPAPNLQKFAVLEQNAAVPTLVYGGEKMGTLQSVRVLSFDQTEQIVTAE